MSKQRHRDIKNVCEGQVCTEAASLMHMEFLLGSPSGAGAELRRPLPLASQSTTALLRHVCIPFMLPAICLSHLYDHLLNKFTLLTILFRKMWVSLLNMENSYHFTEVKDSHKNKHNENKRSDF